MKLTERGVEPGKSKQLIRAIGLLGLGGILMWASGLWSEVSGINDWFRPPNKTDVSGCGTVPAGYGWSSVTTEIIANNQVKVPLNDQVAVNELPNKANAIVHPQPGDKMCINYGQKGTAITVNGRVIYQEPPKR